MQDGPPTRGQPRFGIRPTGMSLALQYHDLCQSIATIEFSPGHYLLTSGFAWWLNLETFFEVAIIEDNFAKLMVVMDGWISR